jgi:hypothetical protein
LRTWAASLNGSFPFGQECEIGVVQTVLLGGTHAVTRLRHVFTVRPLALALRGPARCLPCRLLLLRRGHLRLLHRNPLIVDCCTGTVFGACPRSGSGDWAHARLTGAMSPSTVPSCAGDGREHITSARPASPRCYDSEQRTANDGKCGGDHDG